MCVRRRLCGVVWERRRAARLQARGRARDLGLFADIGAGILVPASVVCGVPDGVAPVELDGVDDKLDACLVSRADGRSPRDGVHRDAGAACTHRRHPLRLAGRAHAWDRR